MKNKFAIVAIASIMALSLSGCGSNTVTNAGKAQEQEVMFERHQIDECYSILVNKETSVCYLEYKFSCYQYGITVMLNADGTPKIWEEN